MKKCIILIAALMCLSHNCSAQNVWEKPVVDKTKSAATKSKQNAKKDEDPKYLAGAVPVVDGMVEWELNVDAPKKNAQEIYDIVLNYLMELTQEPNQLEGSQVSLVNKKDHIIAARIHEWLVFSDKFLALDRTKLNFTLIATCTDGHLNLKMNHINYRYEENRGNNEIYFAEKWITDEEAIKKNGKSFYKGYGKFRKNTIDRKDNLFDIITQLVTK